jgi:hypothetical protein
MTRLAAVRFLYFIAGTAQASSIALFPFTCTASAQSSIAGGGGGSVSLPHSLSLPLWLASPPYNLTSTALRSPSKRRHQS